MIHVKIDEKEYHIPQGWSVATAISHVKGVDGYRVTEHDHPRAPMCHMGVCYECSVDVAGKGRVRGCMVQATEGLTINTLPAASTEEIAPLGERATENEQAYDVAIIGAGPAGMGAADELAASGKAVLLLDEQPKAGGQIYRQAYAEQPAPHLIISTIDEHDTIDRLFGHAVWSIHGYTESDQITTDADERAFFRLFLENHPAIRAKTIVLATGAYDRMYPALGWTLPGVMSAGGIQVLLKTQGYAVGQSIVLTGSHPFLLIVAKLLIESGVEVKGIAFAQSLKTLFRMSKHGVTMLSHFSKLKELKTAIRTVQKKNVPIWFGTIPIEITGKDKVESVTMKQVRSSSSRMQPIPCDVVGMCYGFTPVLDLAKQAGCHIERTSHGTRRAIVDENNQTTVQGIYAAGELVAVGGAERSEVEGRLVGQTLMEPSGVKRASLKKDLMKWDRFAKVLAELEHKAWEIEDLHSFKPAQTLCKCENVTAQDIRQSLDQPSPPTDLNAIKLETRCGMGLCQGKYCEESLYQLATKALRAKPTTDTFNGQSPVKAIVIRDL